MCEDFLNNKEVPFQANDAYEMFQLYQTIIKKNKQYTLPRSGIMVRRIGYGSRVDCIGEFDNELSVIDFKTSKKQKSQAEIEDYFWQTATYALMYEELIGEPINNLVIVMAVENSVPLIFKQQTSDHIPGLVRAIQYYKEQK
jgi:genome maintenance exonuclease 1